MMFYDLSDESGPPRTPMLLMSQNRQAAKDRLAAALDYEVNLKAELSIAHLHDKIDLLQERLGSLPAEAKPRQAPFAEAAE